MSDDSPLWASIARAASEAVRLAQNAVEELSGAFIGKEQRRARWPVPSRLLAGPVIPAPYIRPPGHRFVWQDAYMASCERVGTMQPAKPRTAGLSAVCLRQRCVGYMAWLPQTPQLSHCRRRFCGQGLDHSRHPACNDLHGSADGWAAHAACRLPTTPGASTAGAACRLAPLHQGLEWIPANAGTCGDAHRVLPTCSWFVLGPPTACLPGPLTLALGDHACSAPASSESRWP
jgi:hypothetical protein